MARVKTVSRNLGFFLSDDHLTKHVAGTEEVLQGNLIRVPPNKRLPEETFFSPPWTENVNPSAFPIPEMIDLAAFCLSHISSDNNHLHNFQHTMSTYLAAWHESVCCTPPEPRTPTEFFWFKFNIDGQWKFNFFSWALFQRCAVCSVTSFCLVAFEETKLNLICASSKRLNTTCLQAKGSIQPVCFFENTLGCMTSSWSSSSSPVVEELCFAIIAIQLILTMIMMVKKNWARERKWLDHQVMMNNWMWWWCQWYWW